MRKQVKNLFALFLTASMAVSLVPADAFAAVHDAVKDATTTTAYEKVEAERVAAQPKAGSVEAAIQKALYTNTDEVDLSKYNLTENKAEKLTDKVLGDDKDTDLVDVTYETNANGKVTTMSVEKDATYAYALEEIDELAADDAGTGEDNVTQEEVGKAYQQLMEFYESPDNQEYLGIATPYFTSKDSKGGPVASLLSLMQQTVYKEGVDDPKEDPANTQVSYKDMYDVIQGYQMTLQYGIQLFGQQLLDARDEALAQLDDSMTREQKLLVLNDWLGKYCTFDMGSIQDDQDKKNNTETTEEAIQAMGETAAVALADDGQQQPTEEQLRYVLLNGQMKTAFESTAFGALVRRNTICAGYSSAYTYLVQCAFPEIYKEADGKTWKKASEVNGTDSSQDKKDDTSSSEDKDDTASSEDKDDTSSSENKGDSSEAETETQAADGEDSSEDSSSEKKDETTTETKATYIVDFVKIFWRSNVQMLGQSQTFRNSHYFNAVKTDDSSDNWYYVDSCYNDIYVECMGRNRVETDGNMTHSYFLISHTSLAKQFDGNFDEIDTLYEDKSTDTKYEEAWFTKAQGPISYDKESGNWYYVRNTSSYSYGNGSQGSYQEGNDQLVSRPKSADFAGSDDVTVLVDYKEGTGAVKEGANLLTDSATKDDDVNDEIYPGLTHTSAYYDGAVYVNADNQILKYDLSTNAITKVKEYNEVTVKSVADNMGTGINNNFTGMTFKVTTKDDADAIHTVENHPIAGLSIDSQGNLNVDIATNYCYVDKYQTEQTNYNSGYMNYKFQGKEIKRGGSNDNQEFMWSADFVETLKMSDVTGKSHTHEYETVTVAPTCENAGFTEERCKTCGVVNPGTKKESDAEDAKATDHHYIQYKDETYTKESDAEDAKNVVVDAIVCTKCMKAIPRKSSGNSSSIMGGSDDNSDELDIPEGLKTGHDYTGKITSLSDDKKTGKVTVSCDSCVGKELDFLKAEDVTLATDQEADVTSKKEAEDCEKGGKLIYTAKVTVGDNEYEATTEEEAAAEKHVYKPEFTWADDNTCTVTFTCENCKIPATEADKCDVTSEVTDPTCTEAGKTVYTATATDPNGTKHTSEPKEVEIPATGHTYSADPTYKWADDYKTCKAIFTCDKNDDTQEVECTVTPVTTDATCTEAGKVVYTVTCKFADKDYTTTKEVKVGQKDSKAKFAKTSYNLYSTQSGKLSLASDYKQDGIVSIKSSDPSKVSVNTAGVIKAGVVKGKAVKVTITAVVKSGKTIKTVVTVAPTKITLNATSVPLQLKKSTSVIKVAKATLPGDQVASWSTSNKKVVVVSKSGKITAKKVGTAVVTITMKSGATAKCKVKVQKAAVKLTKIAVNSKKVNLNLKKGPKTYQLTAAKTPVTVVDKVTFTTSNKKVAVVSKTGKITAKKAGKAVITVKCAKKVQKVTVVVKAK